MGSHDGKLYWSYEQVHELVEHAVEADVLEGWTPTLIVCIAAGGFVPSRILRSAFKRKLGYNVPIQTVGLALYDIDGADPATSPVQRTQWLVYGDGPGQVRLNGQRVLIVDEVDDSRKTLAHAVAELQADIAAERAQHQQQQDNGHSASSANGAASNGNAGSGSSSSSWAEPELGVFVLHNKLRPKLAELPPAIMERYFAGMHAPNAWYIYPWDACEIREHTRIAESAGGLVLPGAAAVDGDDASLLAERAKRQSSGCPQQLEPGQRQQLAAMAVAAGGAAGAGGACAAAGANGCAHTNGTARVGATAF